MSVHYTEMVSLGIKVAQRMIYLKSSQYSGKCLFPPKHPIFLPLHVVFMSKAVQS